MEGGIPNEFIKIFWKEVKGDIMETVRKFQRAELQLQGFNCADIIMIPKKEVSESVDDYRPISVVNVIPKLLSKLLANRLANELPALISNYQTAFVRGRHIAESFISTRELLQQISSQKRPALFVKIDFSKAFDSIQWDFLRKVLNSRGFPEKWIDWIDSLLNTATSRIVINGTRGEAFSHKQGLRQGDPLSPMLFLIASDVLQQMVSQVNKTLKSAIARKIPEAIMALQYADDTAFVISGEEETVITFKIMLRLFAKMSGLQINYKNSSFVPFNMSPMEVSKAEAILGCDQTSLPVTYLGMPLTVQRPARALFIPLIEKMENKMQGWKSKMISKGGRLQLVNSVLSAIPSYYMSCFKIPKWTIERMDKIRRDFLWGRNDNGSKGMSLVNWPTVCLPKQVGGMGIVDLEIQNICMLLRWWWRLYNEPQSMWCMIATRLRRRGGETEGPRLWNKRGSFFWGNLQKLKNFFHWGCYPIIGDGRTISFWFDSWGGLPKRSMAGVGMPIQNQKISLRDAIEGQNIGEEDSEGMDRVVLNDLEDAHYWRFESSGQFTTKSMYMAITQGGKIGAKHNYIWKYKVPHTVKNFGYLMLTNRIQTKDNLQRRGMHCDTTCLMCNNCPHESDAHLFFLCPYAIELWFHLGIRGDSIFTSEQMSVSAIWRKFESKTVTRGKHRDKYMARILCAAWLLWKQRNEVIFGGAKIPAKMLAERIEQESKLWEIYC